jgi:hypothetical protein
MLLLLRRCGCTKQCAIFFTGRQYSLVAMAASLIRSSQSSALLDSAVQRMEKLLAKDLTDPIVLYFSRLARGGSEQTFNAGLDAIPKLNADQIQAVTKEWEQALGASLSEQLEDIFVNRARIFSAARLIEEDAELDVTVPTADLFVHRVLQLAAQLYRAQFQQMSKVERAQCAAQAVHMAMDKLQTPQSIIRQKKHASAAAAAEKKSVAAASVKKSVAAASVKAPPSVAPAKTVASRRSKLQDLGFVEEQDEENDVPAPAPAAELPVQAGPVQLQPVTQAHAANPASSVPRPVPVRSKLPAPDAVSVMSQVVRHKQ